MKSGTLLFPLKADGHRLNSSSVTSKWHPNPQGLQHCFIPPLISHPGDPSAPPCHQSRLPSIQCPGNGRVTADAAEWRLLFPGVKQL